MPKISRSALVTYSAQQMYDLVSDIESYGEFLPSCAGGKIISQEGDQLEAILEVAKAGIRQSFSTRNKIVPGVSIEMNLLEGPFKHLSGIWTFTQLGDEGCKVSLELDFEMSNKFTAATLGALVGQMMNSMVDAFSNRAKQIYG
ncbi:type II toxin-antitoxin system RatA family toxin [Endozoicomonas ascidiicola]|uniref:type II toxin-antitoxin system RatA family toxin n=1 Tax=Endozoicomonas ascidiicola TaxID=1698521 RepID=UPI00082DE082|nr:type II toxin-antitoxin system RatA family toxin [Endozoicomonas ascidiicola]